MFGGFRRWRIPLTAVLSFKLSCAVAVGHATATTTIGDEHSTAQQPPESQDKAVLTRDLYVLGKVDWKVACNCVEERKNLPMSVVRSFRKLPYCPNCNSTYWHYYAQSTIAKTCATDANFYDMQYEAIGQDPNLTNVQVIPGSQILSVEEIDALPDDARLPEIQWESLFSEIDHEVALKHFEKGEYLPMGMIRKIKRRSDASWANGDYWPYFVQGQLFGHLNRSKQIESDVFYQTAALIDFLPPNSVPTARDLADLPDDALLPFVPTVVWAELVDWDCVLQCLERGSNLPMSVFRSVRSHENEIPHWEYHLQREIVEFVLSLKQVELDPSSYRNQAHAVEPFSWVVVKQGCQLPSREKLNSLPNSATLPILETESVFPSEGLEEIVWKYVTQKENLPMWLVRSLKVNFGLKSTPYWQYHVQEAVFAKVIESSQKCSELHCLEVLAEILRQKELASDVAPGELSPSLSDLDKLPDSATLPCLKRVSVGRDVNERQ
eukprot:TRINITY_DN7845_c0_g2_i2.p1 TRINITY_DN7845_c0_g2~~TRINITY_DN7845_c0_g2_i2.p1  ORF type:complete len:494 (-),score=89.81 TRINITY_DN7845_c0_g2_i2:35-1516(-)